jgi:gluconokinase
MLAIMTAPPAASTRRLAVVVMGVSGCGKSTVAEGIAAALGLHFIDGDRLHTDENIARMRAGIPLQDPDRWPWLDRVGACLADAGRWPQGVAIACSALRRAYRDRLRAAMPGVRFVFLDGDAALIGSRMALRTGHYMPEAMLASQLQTLERPGADEIDVQRLDIATAPAELVRSAAERLRSGRGEGHRPLLP